MNDTRLDQILQHIDMPPEWWEEGYEELHNMRAELASLRAAASEADALRAEKTKLMWSAIDLMHEREALRAERDEARHTCAALEEKLAEFEEARNRDVGVMQTTIDEANDYIEEQARQIDAAREIFVVLLDMQRYTGKQLLDTWDRADDWMATNAPTPESEQESIS